MARFACNSCLGEFDAVAVDGARYFHACGPETLVAVRRGADRLSVPVADLVANDVVRVLRAGGQVEVSEQRFEPGDLRIGDTLRERSNRRDENVGPEPRYRFRLRDGTEPTGTGETPPGAIRLATLPRHDGDGRREL